jgi:phage terminase large subunit GpA-like protein
MITQIAMPPAATSLLQPPEDLTVSEWCDRFRILHEKDCAEPGPWRTSRVPYLREPQDALTDPNVSTLIFVKSSRVGGTELLNNVLAYSADARPMPAIYVLPREPDVNEEFTGRIRRVFETSPRLQSHHGGANWATDSAIHLDRMTIMGAWATSPESMIRRTSGLNLFDEVDNCEAQSGRLGNIWTLLAERLTTFGYRGKQIGITTPTVSGASGWQAYLASDRRKYWVPCPRCGGYQLLTFERIRFSSSGSMTADELERTESARYECEFCGEFLPEGEKKWMLDRGLWVPSAQKIEETLDIKSRELVDRAALIGADRWTPSLAGAKPRTRHRGYWLPCYYSPWRSFSQILAKFLRVKDDPPALRVVKNQWFAEPWEEAVNVADVDELRKKTINAHPEERIPDRALVLLGGADVQADAIHYVLRAFGEHEESWLIREGTCETFEELDRIAFLTLYERCDGSKQPPLRCSYLAVDSGYRTDEVYDFSLALDPEVVVVKGRDAMPEKHRLSLIDYYPNGKRDPAGVKLVHVNTSFFKSKLNRLMQKRGGDVGAWHLHDQVSEEYLRQVTAEHQVYERGKGRGGKGQYFWKPKAEGRANHKLDCEVYVLALADLKDVRSLRPGDPRLKQEPKPDAPKSENDDRRGRGWLGNKPKGWLNR